LYCLIRGTRRYTSQHCPVSTRYNIAPNVPSVLLDGKRSPLQLALWESKHTCYNRCLRAPIIVEVIMPFANFTNPFQDPANVPDAYRTHPNLEKLFRKDGSGNYIRPAEDPVTIWAIIKLVEEYGVPLDAMQLELGADFSEGTHQGGRRYRGRADVVIYDDRCGRQPRCCLYHG
jgi:hypothetical protein